MTLIGALTMLFQSVDQWVKSGHQQHEECNMLIALSQAKAAYHRGDTGDFGTAELLKAAK